MGFRDDLVVRNVLLCCLLNVQSFFFFHFCNAIWSLTRTHFTGTNILLQNNLLAAGSTKVPGAACMEAVGTCPFPCEFLYYMYIAFLDLLLSSIFFFLSIWCG